MELRVKEDSMVAQDAAATQETLNVTTQVELLAPNSDQLGTETLGAVAASPREAHSSPYGRRLLAVTLAACMAVASCTDKTPVSPPQNFNSSEAHTSASPSPSCPSPSSPLPAQLPAPTSWHPVAAKPGTHAGEPLTNIGFSTYPVRLDGSPGPQLRLQQRYAQLVDAHVKQVRFDAAWDRTEPNRCQFDWSLLDSWMIGLAQRNISALMIADKMPQWATDAPDCGQQNKCEPRDPNDYAQFVSALAARYAQFAPDIELGNELQNILPKVYERMCGLAYAAIKQTSPASLVVFGSKAPTNPRLSNNPDRPAAYFRAVMAARSQKMPCKYDAVAAHPYTGHFLPGQNDAANGWGQMLELLAAMRQTTGYQGQPLWITEFGFPVVRPIDEAQQRNELAAAVSQIARQRSITRLMWFTLATEAGAVDYGAVDAHGRRRPVFDYVQAFNAAHGK